MKKGVLIFIAGVTILAFVLVGFVGSVPTGIVPVIYIESLSIKSMFGENPIVNETTAVKTINVDYYDRDSYTSIDIDGTNYIGYIFTTTVFPENVTYRSFQYSFGENNFVTFNPDNVMASNAGSILVKEYIRTPEMIAAGRWPKFKIDISCEAMDGGNAPEDTIRLVIDYKR
jgi:hypothetical protein